MKAFFGKYSAAKENVHSALNILQNYKTALLEDIMLLPDNNPQKNLKRSRLEQVSAYIESLKSIKDDRLLDSLYGLDNSSYPEPIKRIFKSGNNIFSMVLRPADGFDSHLNSVNPVFYVNREHNTVLFNALYNEFTTLNIMPKQSIGDMLRQKFGEISIQNESDFQDLQTKLGQLLAADFFITNEGVRVTQQYISQQMGNDSMTVDEYIEALIHFCTKNLQQTLESSPFRRIENTDSDKLCLLTQFYLAEINIFCKVHGISNKNFGEVLDKDPSLAEELARVVKSSVESNGSTEMEIVSFINEHQEAFKLSSPLNAAQVTDINSRTQRHFEVVEKMENADEFILTYPDINGKFVAHQGSICTEFAELIKEGFSRNMTPVFTAALHDFQDLDYFVSNTNPSIDYALGIELNQAQQYLTDLITNNHPELAVKIITENYEIIKRMPQLSILAIYNATNRSGLNLLAFAAKNSPEDFAKVASILSKQNLLTCMSSKNRLGDTVLHSILNKPQILQPVVSAIPGDTLAALSQIENSRGETLMNAAKPTSKQIIQDGLNNPNDLIPEVSVEADAELEITENFQSVAVHTTPEPVQVEQIQAEPLSPAETDIEDSDSSIGSERSASPILQSGLSFFRPKAPQKSDKTFHKLYLNSSPDEVIASGARNCFVWQTNSRREFVYISEDGEQNTHKMPINKAFTYQAELQKLANSSGESQESNCMLQVTAEQMQSLLEKAAISSPLFIEALTKYDSDNDQDSEATSDGSVTPH